MIRTCYYVLPKTGEACDNVMKKHTTINIYVYVYDFWINFRPQILTKLYHQIHTIWSGFVHKWSGLNVYTSIMWVQFCQYLCLHLHSTIIAIQSTPRIFLISSTTPFFKFKLIRCVDFGLASHLAIKKVSKKGDPVRLDGSSSLVGQSCGALMGAHCVS